LNEVSRSGAATVNHASWIVRGDRRRAFPVLRCPSFSRAASGRLRHVDDVALRPPPELRRAPRRRNILRMPTPIISVARRSATPLALLALILVTWACREKTPPPTKSETTTAAPAAPVTAPAAPTAVNAPDSFRVAFATSRGPFVVAVTRAWSPKGADRFYELVKTGYFTDVRFFRVIPRFVEQFGMHGDPKTNDKWKERTIPDDPV